MVGVCTGISNKINFNDVIIAEKIIAYEKEKITELGLFKSTKKIQRVEVYAPSGLFKIISTLNFFVRRQIGELSKI